MELEDGGKDLAVKVLDLFLPSTQHLEFKVRDLGEERSRDHAGRFIDACPESRAVS